MKKLFAPAVAAVLSLVGCAAEAGRIQADPAVQAVYAGGRK